MKEFLDFLENGSGWVYALILAVVLLVLSAMVFSFASNVVNPNKPCPCKSCPCQSK